jgi:hypothetical protein
MILKINGILIMQVHLLVIRFLMNSTHRYMRQNSVPGKYLPHFLL